MRKRVLCHMRTTKRRSACASAQSDLRLCFRCLDSIISLDSIAEIFKTLASFCGCAGRFVSGLAWSETPEDTVCHVVAHLISRLYSILDSTSLIVMSSTQ